MKRSFAALLGGLVVVTTGVLGPSPARGVGDVENRTPKMVGGGWVGVTNPEQKVHIRVHLPCGGDEVGFNPQPDPPGRVQARLDVNQGTQRFSLTRLDTSSCTIGNPDLIVGSGVGMCDGAVHSVAFRLTDGGGRSGVGNPDIRPTVQIDIRGDSSVCSGSVDGALAGGNIHLVGDPTDR